MFLLLTLCAQPKGQMCPWKLLVRGAYNGAHCLAGRQAGTPRVVGIMMILVTRCFHKLLLKWGCEEFIQTSLIK